MVPLLNVLHCHYCTGYSINCPLCYSYKLDPFQYLSITYPAILKQSVCFWYFHLFHFIKYLQFMSPLLAHMQTSHQSSDIIQMVPLHKGFSDLPKTDYISPSQRDIYFYFSSSKYTPLNLPIISILIYLN
jgi:hypothetical protein